MKGVIDNVSKDFTRIAGWVVLDEGNPILKAEHQGQSFGKGRFLPAYDSLKALHGENAKVFEIEFQQPLGALEIALHGLRVSITDKHGSKGEVLPTQGFRDTVLNQAKKQLLRLDDSGKKTLLSALGVVPPVVMDIFGDVSLAPLHFQTGLSSNDTILGRNGFIFYTGSDHSLLKRYDNDETRVHAKEKAEAWNNRISVRARRASEAGPQFRQVVLPDKLTILGDYSHRKMTGPSVYLEEFRSALGNSENLIDPMEHFLSFNTREKLWPLTDSHSSATGMKEVVKLLFTSLGIDSGPVTDVDLNQKRVHTGDIGDRFFGIKPKEIVEQPVDRAFKGSAPKMEVLRKPDRVGSETGLHVRYKNPYAVTQKSVILFGGSSSSQGLDPMNLSWWFKHYFASFEFVFSRDIDWNLVKGRQPDYVIAQTIERYLPQVPTD